LAPFHNEDEDIMSMRVKREKRVGWKNVQKSSEKKKKKVGKPVLKNTNQHNFFFFGYI